MAELTTPARPYAKAAFEVAKEGKALDAWAEHLALVEAVIGDEKIQQLLDSPALTAGLKSKALQEVLGESVDKKFFNFLSTLAENKRLLLIPTIKQMFLALKAQQEKTIEVDIISAFELSSDTKDTLISALKAKLDREVSMNTSVDTSLLGGALIRAGDTVIDGSVKGRLAKLSEAMNS